MLIILHLFADQGCYKVIRQTIQGPKAGDEKGQGVLLTDIYTINIRYQ